MHPTLNTSPTLEALFIDVNRWIAEYPLGAILLVLVAWGLWFRKDRF